MEAYLKYHNPIIRGFYPDPSVCEANGRYYMVCSSFHFYPGVPLFESEDLVNWKQIGHCLTRRSQVMLDRIGSSGGVFAPCIRYYKGRFYMVTTNTSTEQNFYIWTDDIYGEWSDPVIVEQDGIDPSLYFEDDRCYFMSNGTDAEGVGGIVQCEIEIASGKKLSDSRTIWKGTGGRYLEGPHLYRFGEYYYLLAAEGGTEFGHMVTYARGKHIFGPFESYKNNPVLTNRNLGGYLIQGVGHGDIVKAQDGSYWLIHLGFRQISKWSPFHHLGREVYISPVRFDKEGWFEAGTHGTTTEIVELFHVKSRQKRRNNESFSNTVQSLDWCYLRHPVMENYTMTKDELLLTGTSISLNDIDTPTFIGLRQKDFCLYLTCSIEIDGGEAGISFFMDENHHYDFAIRNEDDGFHAITRLCIGNLKTITEDHYLGKAPEMKAVIDSDSQQYRFFIQSEDKKIPMGTGLTRYLSSEVATGFTGVIIGLYAVGAQSGNHAKFHDFQCEYFPE